MPPPLYLWGANPQYALDRRVWAIRITANMAMPKSDMIRNSEEQTNKQTNSVALSPRANYTDWATATCRRNLVSTFVDRGGCRVVSTVFEIMESTVVKLDVTDHVLKSHSWKLNLLKRVETLQHRKIHNPIFASQPNSECRNNTGVMTFYVNTSDMSGLVRLG
jgi:hypothetical protein